jgi:chitinase
VRTQLTDDRFIVTAALPASPLVLRNIDLQTLATLVDHVNLRAYDFFGVWGPNTGHHAQLYAMSKDEVSGSVGVGFLISKGVPANKILLGIPAHGQSFLSAAGPGQSFRGGGGEAGCFPYNQLPRPGSRELIDKRYVAAQCLGGDGGFVTYDNAETAKTKAEFAKQKGLAVSNDMRTYYSDQAEIENTNRASFTATSQPIRRTSRGV